MLEQRAHADDSCQQERNEDGRRDQLHAHARDGVRVREARQERRHDPLLRRAGRRSEDATLEARLRMLRQVSTEGPGDLGVGQRSGVHASASSAFSSAARAACSRHLAVPIGTPSDRAISATGRSST